MKNLFLVFLLNFTLTLSSSAQYNPDKVDRKAVALYDKAMELADASQFKQAVVMLQQAVATDPSYVEGYLSLAGVYGQLKEYALSTATYEKAFAKDSVYTKGFWLPYAINTAGKGEFEKALQVVNRILAQPKLHPTTQKAAEYRQKSFQFAVDWAKAHPNNYVFAPKNLGGGINTEALEYSPSMPVDGKLLVFTRKGRRDEDFYAAEKTTDGWGPAQRLPGNINTPQNEGAQNISQDGRWLIFTGCDRPEGQGSCDLYISYQTAEGWSEAFNLGPAVNSDQWDSQPCLSPDKRELYFTSRRFGGLGGADLYVCRLQANGKWSRPENLGLGINSKGDEFAPFMHADNQTLYFSSNGRTGYGGEDLFVVRKKADGTWGEPENLGYPINSIDNENTLFVGADGATAYYASDRSEGRGGTDIYSFTLREDVRPAKTLWVKGKVFDKKTGAGLPSSVELIDLAGKRTLLNVQTDETGAYLMTLPVGKDYAFNVNRRGYLFYSGNFSLASRVTDSTYQKDIPLQPIEVNAAVVLRNLFFDTKKFDIKPASEAELEKLVQLLQDNPTVRIQLEGHTDNVGTAADNQKLSDARARAVVNYLIGKGIKPDRLSAKGFGAAKPVADNKTEEGRAMNRRTELKVLAK